MSYPCPICNAANFATCNHGTLDTRFGAVRYSDRPKALSYYNTEARTLSSANLGGLLSIWQKFDRALATKRQNAVPNCVWDNQFVTSYTVQDLKNASLDLKIRIIDEIYKEIIDFHPYINAVKLMEDPREENDPSSLSTDTKMFSKHGICYRCDTRSPDDVLQHGFIPSYQFSPATDVQGTILCKCCTGTGMPMSVGYWKANQDIVNETSVCVARCLQGVPKFPRPSSQGSHYIYAFQLSQEKVGVDTEALQPMNRRWYYGEKAFHDLKPTECIAWIPIDKLGGTDVPVVYHYKFLSKNWNFTANATSFERKYLENELRELFGILGNPFSYNKTTRDFAG